MAKRGFGASVCLWLVLSALAAALVFIGPDSPATQTGAPRPLFKPSALWMSADGEALYVAGAGDGNVAVIDTVRGIVVEEFTVGRSLTALAGDTGGRLLVAVDAATEQLVVFDRHGKVLHRLATAAGPSRVTLIEDDEACFAAVSCRWGRRVQFFEVRRGQKAGSVELGYCPGEILYLPEHNLLVVADAFGGTVSVYAVTTALLPDRTWRLYAERVLERHVPAHNIRGLAADRRERFLVITHMLLTESAPTTRENVHWGVTMTSNLRVLPLETFLRAEDNPFSAGRTHFVGEAGHAAGDPGAVAVTRTEQIVFCIGGVHDVGLVGLHEFGVRRIDVGRRPLALVLSPDESTAYVANYFDDSVSVVDLGSEQLVRTIRLRRKRPLSLVERGEQLFYDATLSLDGWYSCASCHTDGHTCGLSADTLGDGSYGAPKNIPTLYGTGTTGPWGWIGMFDSLTDQVTASLRTSMRSPRELSPEMVAALVAYLRTLPPPPSARYRKLVPEKVQRGRALFRRLHCHRCHRPVGYYTSEGVHDVGLDDGPGGNRAFNPPSLRGLAYTAPYLHDGRAATLHEVFTRWRHKVPARLTAQEVDDLVEFLLSL